MEGKGIAELSKVVVPAATVFGRVVNGYSEVEAENEETEVVAETGAGAEGDVVKEVLEGELSAGACLIATHEPHVACVDEYCAVKPASQREPELGAGFELALAGLVHVGVAGLRGVVVSGTDGTDRETADAVGSAAVELVVIGRYGSIAV